MNRAGMAFVVGAFFCMSAAAQPQTGAQAGAQSSSQASVQAGQTQAQASGNASVSTSASAQNGQVNSSLAAGTAFNAALSSPVDSEKCKPDKPVNARTTEAVKSEGKSVIPKGAKVIGHVTQASARAKGESESALGIVFDKVILKNSQEIPLSVGIQAIAAAQNNASAAGSDMDVMGSMGASAAGSGRGALGGVTSAAGGAVGAVTNTAASAGGVAGGAVNSAANAGGSIAGASKGAVGGLNAAGQLTSNSQGVFGLNGLNLNAAASNATQGSVVTSSGKNVHLDSGTRMLLVSQGGGQGASKQTSANKPEPKSEPKSEPNKPNKQ